MVMKNVIQPEKRFAFKANRLSKQVRTVDVIRKLRNSVIGKKRVVESRCYPWRYQGKHCNMNGDETADFDVDE